MAEQSTKSTDTLASTPPSWPGAFGLYKYSREAVKFNFWVLAGIWLTVAVVNAVLRSFFKDAGDALGLLISTFASVAYVLVYVASVRREKVSFSETLNQSVSIWLKMIGLTLLTAAVVIISILLFIIPFFFVAPRLILASYYLVDKKQGVIESLNSSWAATKGYTGKIWGIFGAALAMALLAFTVIGIPFAIYFLIMYSAATAVAYEFISKSQPKVKETPEIATA